MFAHQQIVAQQSKHSIECVRKIRCGNKRSVANIGSSAAFANLGGPDWVRVAAALIAVPSTLALVLGLGDRARRHAEFAAKFTALEADIVGHGERDYSEADIARWAAQIRTLEAGEPATLYALATLCQNRLVVAQSHPGAGGGAAVVAALAGAGGGVFAANPSIKTAIKTSNYIILHR